MSSTFLHQALKDSLKSGVFIDTKFYAYSKRSASGSVYEPKELFVNSHVLKQVPHFASLLFEGYAEGTTRDIRSDHPSEHSRTTDGYDYLSDSDLEDDPADAEEEAETSQADAAAESSSESGNIEDDSENQAQPNHRDPFDLDIFPHPSEDLSDIYVHPPEVKENPGYGDQPEEYGEQPEAEEKEPVEELDINRPVHRGKVVMIKDAAHTTLQALFLFLYTGEIEFAPFGSDANRNSRNLNASNEDGKTMPKASPKSIYRLADKYEIAGLKKLAFDHICANLSNCDIVEELFSEFTSCYDEVLKAEVQQLASVIQQSTTTPNKTTELLNEKIESFAKGDIPHCAEAFTSLFDTLSDENWRPSTTPAPTVPVLKTTAYWVKLKTALNKSLITGTFLDLRINAYSSKCQFGKPISLYFSRMVVDHFFVKLEECTTTLNVEDFIDAKAPKIVVDYEEDSDLEDEIMPLVNRTERENLLTGTLSSTSAYGIAENPSTHGEKSVKAFKMGAASTWQTLLFHVYTDSVKFATLRSDGLEARMKVIEEHKGKFAHLPEPCSPKSLYMLAAKLDLDALRDKAFNDLESKISANNVVLELFSKFSSFEEKVLKMENTALGDKFKTGTADTVKNNIRSMADGKASYQSEALKSVFQRICTGKPQVDLRCDSYCGGLYPISSLRSGIYCPGYHSGYGSNYYMHCNGCRTQRSGNTTICNSCKARGIRKSPKR